MAVQNIFSYLNTAEGNRGAMLEGVQRSLIQTRQLQLQEQQRMIDNSFTMRKLDFQEKQQGFENVMALKRLDMQERQMGMGDLLEAERIKSTQALTAYREAQTAKLTARDTAAGYMEYPLNGTAEDWVNYNNQVETGAQAIEQTYDPNLQGVLNEFSEPPVSTTDLPTDDGADALPSLFDEGPLADVGGPLARLAPDPRATTLPQAAGTVAAQAEASKAPASQFDVVNKTINQQIARILNDPNKPQGVKLAETQALKGNLMRIAATEFNEDPKAAAFLNDSAPERTAIESAAARGDDAMARSLMNESVQRLGYMNPVNSDAYQRGSRLYMQTQEKLEKRDELKELMSTKATMTSNASEVPPWMEARIDQLAKELYGPTSTPESMAESLNIDRPPTR